MALTVGYVDYSLTGSTLAFAVQRVSDGYVYDSSDGTFKDKGSISGTNWQNTLTEGTTFHLGLFTGSISSTPSSQWTDGRYRVTIHDTSDANKTLYAGEVFFHEGDQVDVDADVLDTVGYDSNATVHGKLGGFTGASGDTVKDKLNQIASANIIFSVAADVFQVISDVGRFASSIGESFTIAVKKEHQKKVSLQIKTLDGSAFDLTGMKVRVVCQEQKGEPYYGNYIFDYNTTDDPSSLNITDAANGQLEWVISQADSDQSLTGGANSDGVYYLEFLLDRTGTSGKWELIASGWFKVEAGVDLLAN